jgi:methyl-accepting chemotaxis protein
MPRISVVAFVLISLVVAAGCGGSSSNESSAEEWAGGLCSALTTWTNSVKSASNSLRSNPSKDSLKSAAGDIESASDTLVGDLKDLGKPDTKSGQDAKDAVDQLSSEVGDDVQEMQSAVDKVSGVQGVLAATSSVSATLSKMGNQINSAASKLDSADPGGELKQAFQNAPACKSLTSPSS